MLCPLLAVGAAAQGVPQTQTSPAPARQPAACGCPSIAAVATSDHPAPGRVKDELGFAELEAFMSTRAARYDGDWDKAMLALAHELDPSGALGISTGPAPASATNALLFEGGMSAWLLTGVRSENLSIAANMRFNLGPFAMHSIIVTIARINKYGEPVFGLRKALLRSARFLAGDLDRMKRGAAGASGVAGAPPPSQASLPASPPAAPPQPAGGPPLVPTLSARPASPLAPPRDVQVPMVPALGVVRPTSVEDRISVASAQSRRALWEALQNANPAQQLRKKLRQADSKPAPGPADALPLDDYDLAAAALEIMLSVDDKGKQDGLLNYDQRDGEPLVEKLGDLTGVLPQFGGAAAPDSPEAAVGCAAFMVLATLAGYRNPDGAKYREELFSSVFVRRDFWRVNASPTERVAFVGARAALLSGGIADPGEAAHLADRVFDLMRHEVSVITLGMNYYGSGGKAGDQVALESLVETLHDGQAYLAGPGQAAFSAKLQDDLALMQRRADGGGMDSGLAKAVVAAWGSAGVNPDASAIPRLCPPPAAPPRVLLFTQGLYEPILLDKLYTNIPLMIGVTFAEGYDGGTWPVSVQTSGGKVDLVAKRLKDNPQLYLTETFVLGTQ